MIIRELLQGHLIIQLIDNSGYHMNHGVTISHHRINGIHMGVSNPWGYPPNFHPCYFWISHENHPANLGIPPWLNCPPPEKIGPAPPGRSQALMAAFNEMVSICSDASPISCRKASAICRNKAWLWWLKTYDHWERLPSIFPAVLIIGKITKKQCPAVLIFMRQLGFWMLSTRLWELEI